MRGFQSGAGIRYNHLNLPYYIVVNGKGTVEYEYDAAGNKLKKMAYDNATGLTKTTTYIAGLVYENDTLQFIGHEEGRIRPTPNDQPATGFAYDYFIKDHLGNVRMVLTDEPQTDQYPVATMETATATDEELFYSNLSSTREGLPANYPPNTPAGNAQVARVNGNMATDPGGTIIGPSMVLKVMAGDKFHVSVDSWYKLNAGQTPAAPTGIAGLLIGALNYAVGGLAGGKASAAELNNAGAFVPGATTFVNNQSNNSSNNVPRAYINWILFDEQFNYVSSSSGFEQVPAESYYHNGNYPNNITKLHVHNDMPIDKSGFLYIYVSNQTPNINVFFDNLKVTHVRGQILEETHYYPFGLTMSGISSKAAGGLENKKKYNGYEFNSDFDINLYESFYRSHDPQLGRFWQLDPKPNYEESLYAAMGNNPILNFDLLGDTIPVRTARSGADGQADIKTFCNLLGGITGNTYDVVDGQLKRTNAELNTETNGSVSGDLSKLIDNMINGATNTPMTLENSDASNKEIKFDVAKSGRIDLKDFTNIKDNVFKVGLISHIFDEHRQLPSDLTKRTDALIDAAHAKAKVTEASFMSKMLGIPLSPRTEHWGDPKQLTQNITVYPYTWNYGNAQYEGRFLQAKKPIGVMLIPYPSGVIIDLFRKK